MDERESKLKNTIGQDLQTQVDQYKKDNDGQYK